MREIYAKNVPTIDLGRQGENLVTQVIYDLSDWIAAYGDGTAELIHKRIGDSQPYPVAAVREGNSLIWTITSTDTAVATRPLSGYGQCELRWYSGDVLAKSKTWKTMVSRAMEAPSETAPPDPEQGWVDQVLAAGASAKEAADKAFSALSNAPYIGDNGNWYLGGTDTGKPSRGEAGPALAVTNTAAVGQTVKITAVDENGQPTEWEAVDMPSGGGASEWTEIGEITLDGTEFIISDYSDGVVTIAPENGVYPQVNKNTVLRKSDSSSYINVRFVATGTDGQYTMKNLDGAVYAPSDDLTQYVVDVPSADSLSFSNIPAFSFFKAKITTPLLCVHGVRISFINSYDPFNIVGSDCTGLSGGAAELVLETEDSPIAGKIYSKGSFKGKSASRQNGYDVIRMFDRPTAPANITFTHYSGLLTIGTKVKLWGRN